MIKLSTILIIIGVLLLALGTGVSPAFLGSIISFEASVGGATVGASAEELTSIQAGSGVAGIVLLVAGIYLRSKKQ